MDLSQWRPADYQAVIQLGLQCLGILVVAVGFFSTRKMVNGRMSQLIDLVGRLAGAPERRNAPGGDRRTADGKE